MRIQVGQDCVIPDEKLHRFLDVLINTYFAKWKRKIGSMTDEDWDQAVEELKQIWEQGREWPIVGELCMVFLDELEARARGGRYLPRDEYGRRL